MRAGLGETCMHSHPGDRITSPGVQGSNLFQKSWVLTSIDSSRKKNCWPFLSLTWGLHSVFLLAKLCNQEYPFPINPAHLHYLISQHCGDSVVETWVSIHSTSHDPLVYKNVCDSDASTKVRLPRSNHVCTHRTVWVSRGVNSPTLNTAGDSMQSISTFITFIRFLSCADSLVHSHPDLWVKALLRTPRKVSKMSVLHEGFVVVSTSLQSLVHVILWCTMRPW